MKKVNYVLLIDDNQPEYRYNQIIIEEAGVTDEIKIVENGLEALNFLKDENNELPELIFLDIYMHKMNGWEFLAEYVKLERIKKAKIILVVLSNSSNPEDLNKAEEIKEVNYFQLKPLTKYTLNEIMERFF